MNPSATLWQTKLHARLHDPAEKALVLLRDPAGHEGGSSRTLHAVLFGNDGQVPDPARGHVKRADRWAAAADRPQWPLQEITVTTRSGEEKVLKVAPGAQVRWTKQPVLIHPLTGKTFDLGRFGGLGDADLDELKAKTFFHFEGLIQRDERGAVDWPRTLLAAWRFGPEPRDEARDNGRIGLLWPLLPADTRVPDHSIWDHLDLTSAFAGAFADDPAGEAALLTVSLGPVQSFIAAARSTSDLWAGSHLLSNLSWEAMKPLCEALGPDAVLFPRLRGVALVDQWLRDECRLPARLFADAGWTTRQTDANPLFAAALPNRFVALVPAAKAAGLARACEHAARAWLQTLGQQVVDRLLDAAGMTCEAGASSHAHHQARAQLEGFPEVHWAAVPFSLAVAGDAERETRLDTTALSAAMAPLFGAPVGQPAGFLASPAWQVLREDVRWDGDTVFWSPNPGALYPAVHELAERALAAAKAVRPFAALPQQGYRCSLTGETEWLTTDPAQLHAAPGQRRETLWTRVAERRPAWARKGEHLGALAAVKRLWPTVFAERVGQSLQADVPDGSGARSEAARRFVVSTHTMALAAQLDGWLKRGGHTAPGLAAAFDRHEADRVALPRKLLRDHAQSPALADAARLPGLLERAAELDEQGGDPDAREAQRLRLLVADTLGTRTGEIEAYHGLVLMDGDHMGRWLAGGEKHAISYRESFHPQVHTGFDVHAAREPRLAAYGEQARAVSPNRHLSISGALGDFSQVVVPHVVEREFLGRLIYAGGDDVLAMLPVADLLPAMRRLRVAYSGHDPAHPEGAFDRDGLTLHAGYALLRESSDRLRLMRMMGHRATASAGAVVAHHQAPLGAVLRELRAAEQRAKGEGGRDAFNLTVVKRAGGTLRVSAKWGEPVALLHALIGFLADDGVSRRAVYNSLEWLKDLPPDAPDMVAALLVQQFLRQADRPARDAHDVPGLAWRLAALAFDEKLRPAPRDDEPRLAWLADFMGVAEFLARATRQRDAAGDAPDLARPAARKG